VTTTNPLKDRRVICLHCEQQTSASKEKCEHCGSPLSPNSSASTGILNRRPRTLPVSRSGDQRFAAHVHAILQFLPSGLSISIALDKPVILGRSTQVNGQPDECDMLDLTELNALQHGVSRQHCMLRRRDERLVVIDLSSTNGTYLNDKLLLPQQEFAVAHADKLILGTLHLTLFFNS
jgi:hypothetical protein